ncbi:MAG: methyltransferase [Oscillospiraceae bacterium]
MEDFLYPLLPGIELVLDRRHPVTTDPILLARFAAPGSKDRVCDLCCGMGIVPMLWFGQDEVRPRSVAGVDLDGSAIALFARSIVRNGLGELVRALEGDLRAPMTVPELGPGSFDLVTCNPPYYPSDYSAGVGEDPLRAKARRELTCSLPDVCRTAARLLRFGGRFCVCHRPARLPDLLEAMRAERLEPKRLRLVSHRPDSPPFLVLAEGRLGAKPSLDLRAPLFLTDSAGAATAEILEIYRMR